MVSSYTTNSNNVCLKWIPPEDKNRAPGTKFKPKESAQSINTTMYSVLTVAIGVPQTYASSQSALLYHFFEPAGYKLIYLVMSSVCPHYWFLVRVVKQSILQNTQVSLSETLFLRSTWLRLITGLSLNSHTELTQEYLLWTFPPAVKHTIPRSRGRLTRDYGLAFSAVALWSLSGG